MLKTDGLYGTLLQFVEHSDQHGYFTASNMLLAVANGRLIDAIKILRKLDSNVEGLKEAKDIVEACVSGGYQRVAQRNERHADPVEHDNAGSYFVIPADGTFWMHHTKSDAVQDAKTRNWDECYVVKAVASVTVTVKVEDIA